MKTKAEPGFFRVVRTVVVLSAAGLMLCGCAGADDVEINLPLVGDVMKKSRPTEEKLASRGSLVLPPKTDALPEPVDEGAAAANGVESWPDDPDLKAKREKEIALAEKQRLEKEGDWKNEHSTGNGLEDFNKKTQWSERQTGILDKLLKDE